MTMRYLMKGGYWKNSEDEILKTAVIKYGFNQWSRISSLLARKSAKQCKARWYEWLDPSIKKTPWTNEEEEKLLHLAKTFPSQWRVIAPIVGRTAAQCVEHYERLLDQAQGRDSTMENDPRKIRPGEIDPNPETKPARADAKDMDDDEKELIAEVRVRVANIKGKKAKRRFREKFIERSRQMAQLQKERELKAAGIEYIIEKKKKRKNEEIDYNKEIPFESRPVEIVYKTGEEENPTANPNLGNISINALEGERRDVEEKKMRELDQKKAKKQRSLDLPSQIEKVNRNNPLLYQKKARIVLPEPQLNESDLELLGKMTKSTSEFASDGGSLATKQLLGNYSIREPTPVQTPKISSVLMREARDAIALTNAPTPLAGGDNPELEGRLSSLRKEQSKATPNPYKTMLSNTPISRYRGETPLSITTNRVPVSEGDEVASTYNDELSLNNDEWADSVWEDKVHEEEIVKSQSKHIHIREIVRKHLSHLPQPQNNFDIVFPDLEEFKKKAAMLNEKMEVADAEDLEKLRAKKLKENELKTVLKQSSSVRLGLPRPSKLPKKIVDKLKGSAQDPMALIEREAIQMIINDSIDHPLKKRGYGEMLGYYKPDNDLNLEELELAQYLIEEELKNCPSYNAQIKAANEVMLNQFKEDWSKAKSKKKHSRKVGKSSNLLKPALQKSETVSVSLQEKLISTPEVEEQLLSLLNTINLRKIELDVYEKLREQEQKAAKIRVEEIKDYVLKLQRKERELQMMYLRASNQIEDLDKSN